MQETDLGELDRMIIFNNLELGHLDGFGLGGNWRQNVPNNSMQITAQKLTQNIQIDIDPNNPNLLGGGDVMSFFGHMGNVLHNTATGTDTNYANVASALSLNLYNCH